MKALRKETIIVGEVACFADVLSAVQESNVYLFNK